VSYALKFVRCEATDESDVHRIVLIAASRIGRDDPLCSRLQDCISPLDRQKVASSIVHLCSAPGAFHRFATLCDSALHELNSAFPVLLVRAFELMFLAESVLPDDAGRLVEHEPASRLELLRQIATIKYVVDNIDAAKLRSKSLALCDTFSRIALKFCVLAYISTGPKLSFPA
jgi:hypothetical protein